MSNINFFKVEVNSFTNSLLLSVTITFVLSNIFLAKITLMLIKYLLLYDLLMVQYKHILYHLVNIINQQIEYNQN